MKTKHLALHIYNFLLIVSAFAFYGCDPEIKPLTRLSITTAEATSITSTSATTGGTITDDGSTLFYARGVCWADKPGPTLEDSVTKEGRGAGTFSSVLTRLKTGTRYYVRAFMSTSEGIGYGNEISFTSGYGVPELTTTAFTVETNNSVTTGGQIQHDGGQAVLAKGVCWSTSPEPTIGLVTKTNEGSGSQPFTSILTGLDPTTVYYARAYALNETGVGYGNEIRVQVIGTVTNPITGRTWMDRNLGATRVARRSVDPEAYGDLYQWGRGADGHEKRNSPTTTTLSTTDNPGHGNFIYKPGIHQTYDWRATPNNDLWQGPDGINNPCPDCFRLPTIQEWMEESKTWSAYTPVGAINSVLKLPTAGFRYRSTGSTGSVGTHGYYWSSTAGPGGQAVGFMIYDPVAMPIDRDRANGQSVRCIKDE